MTRRAPAATPTFRCERVLKQDHLGCIEVGTLDLSLGPRPAIRRLVSASRWWARPIAGLLARREARALRRLGDTLGLPSLLVQRRGEILRSLLPGHPLHEVRPQNPEFYRSARQLLHRMHQRGVTHNDTHKAPNWIVQDDGSPGLVDFQLASTFRRRTRWFRLLALEDLRHLLKHQRRYAPLSLTASMHRLLARRSWPARAWRRSIKPVYLLVTRRWLGRRDDEGRGGRPRNASG